MAKEAAVVYVQLAWDDVLLLKRGAAAPTYPSSWCLPGGHLCAGESPAETAARELEEETGIQAEFLRPFGTYIGRKPSVIIHCFVLYLHTQPEVELSWEHQKFAWEHPARALDQYDLAGKATRLFLQWGTP